MPIVYETPAPIGIIGAVAEESARNAARQRAAVEAASSGGAYGRGGGGFADFDIQAAIANRDRNAIGVEQFNAQRMSQPRDIDEMAFAKSQMQQQFVLQAQLEETRLGQQERMRLQRLQNSLSMVASDPSLSTEEKNEVIARLKYEISPLQMRQAKEKVEQDRIIKEAMVEQKRAASALALEEGKVAASTFADRTSYFVDPKILTNIVADLKANTPMADMIPPELFEKMAKQEAMRQGLGMTMYQESFGKWKPMEGEAGGSGSGSRGRGQSDRPQHESGLSPQDYVRARRDFAKEVDDMASETTTDELGNKVPRYPELADPNKRSELVKTMLRQAGLPGDLTEYQKGLEQPEQKGYQSQFGTKPKDQNNPKPGAEPNASTGEQPKPKAQEDKPFSFTDQKSLTPRQKVIVDTFVEMDKQIAALGLQKGGPLSAKWSEAKMLISNAGSRANMDASQKVRYDRLLSEIDAALDERPKPGTQAPQQAQEQPGTRSILGQAYDWVTDPNTGRGVIDIPAALNKVLK